jgi:hypothetical protein
MSIITGAYFPTAGTIVDDFLLVLEIPKVSTDHWTKFVVIRVRSLIGVDRRERAESQQQ